MLAGHKLPDGVSRREFIEGAGAGLGFLAIGAGSAGAAGSERRIVGTSTRAATERAKRKADSVYRVLDFGDIGQAVAGQFSEEALDALRNNPNVRYIETDGEMEALDTELDNSWGVDRVDAAKAHAAGETGGDDNGSDLAIIDTGIDPDHPDLQRESNGGNVGAGKAFVECKGSPTDCEERWSDDNGHGTHCAGIADALDNDNGGVVGVSTDATLHAVKVLDKNGSGSYSDVAAGIEYVADQGWDVGSMSLGGGDSQTVQDACQYAYDKGVLLVAAAGNDGSCTDCVSYPAAYSTVIAVSATAKDDSLAGFSSTGPEVELAAPGKDVYSTYDDGTYETLSGTSMACPHVSGAAGQLMDGGYTNVAARQQLDKTAEDIGLGDNESGNGLLDAATALCYDSSDSGSNSHAPPTVVTSWATGIGTTAATLNGRLTCLEGSDDDVYFQYRQTGASSWSKTSVQTLSSTGAFSASVSSLNSGTEYEFRAVVEKDADGTTESADDTGWTLTFTTDSSDTDVAVKTKSATNVTDSSATLNGDLTDLGGADSADVYFEWRESGTSSWDTTTKQTLSSTGSFSEDISGLSSDTKYEFRAVAEASDGDTDTGDTLTFTTDSSSSGNAPTVDSLSLSEDNSGGSPHAEFSASWSVSDSDGDLDTVDLTLTDLDDGETEDSASIDVSGDSASGTTELKAKFEENSDHEYEVECVVTDSNGNTDSATATEVEDGS